MGMEAVLPFLLTTQPALQALGVGQAMHLLLHRSSHSGMGLQKQGWERQAAAFPVLLGIPGRRMHSSSVAGGNPAVTLDKEEERGTSLGWCHRRNSGVLVTSLGNKSIPWALGRIFSLQCNFYSLGDCTSKWANTWLMHLIAAVSLKLLIQNLPIIMKSKSLCWYQRGHRCFPLDWGMVVTNEWTDCLTGILLMWRSLLT